MARGPKIAVLGLGGMGSAAAWRLARAGAEVLAFDPHPIGHAFGSSHGEARMIRQAYFEHADYVPLLKSAYRLWSELEEESAKSLFHRTGVVIYGPSHGGAILPAVAESARTHGLEIEHLTEKEAARRFPEYRPPSGFEAILEPNAGYLEVENAVTQAARLAAESGAKLHLGETVREWHPAAQGGVEVRTDRGTYHADKLVITAGPWSQRILGPQVAMSLEPRRVVQFWFEARVPRYDSMPCFGFELPSGFFYGFPLGPSVVKAALHRPGEPVNDPAHLDRGLHPSDSEPVLGFSRECLPTVASNRVLRHSVCMYTMSADQHFVIDLHPLSPNVVFAAGFSGHGFKFAPVIGEILSDLALHGETRHPIGFLRLR